MRRCVVLVFLLVGLTLSACSVPPESRVALSEPGEAAYDKRLVGNWYLIPGKNVTSYLHITPGKETGYLNIIGIIAFNNDDNDYQFGAVRWFRATAYASEIDGQTYYNVKRVSGTGDDYTAPEESPGFIIIRADLTDEDSLILRSMDTRVFGKLVKVPGRKVEGKYRDEKVSYRIMDLSRPELVDMIRVFPPAEFYSEERPFRRLKPDAEKAKP